MQVKPYYFLRNDKVIADKNQDWLMVNLSFPYAWFILAISQDKSRISQ